MMSSNHVDRLSKLPDEIRSHILSLMPTKFAVRTCILSKRWRYAWTFVTNLDFDLLGSRCVVSDSPEFVHWVLNSCKASQFNLFRLLLPEFAALESDVSNWIYKAVKLNVRELCINFSMLAFPLSFFTCKTLTKLSISDTHHGHGVWEFPCLVNLPSLKTLEIVVRASSIVHVNKLISGSPMLECLSLWMLPLFSSNDDNDYTYAFNIPTLKRFELMLIECKQASRRVVLNVPNLEYLFVRGGGNGFPVFVMKDVSSLVEASISPSDLPNYAWTELLKGVSGVKSLSLRSIRDVSLLPIFPNLKHLELKSMCSSERLVPFLENCPQMKHLYIREEGDFVWSEPELVPTCIRTKLTTLKYSINIRWKPQIQFLEYIFENAESLKKVTVIWNNATMEDEEWLSTQLRKLTRASRCCELQFHGNLSHSISV